MSNQNDLVFMAAPPSQARLPEPSSSLCVAMIDAWVRTAVEGQQEITGM